MGDFACRIIGHKWGDPKPRYYRLPGSYQECARCKRTRVRFDLPNEAELLESDCSQDDDLQKAGEP